MCCQVLQCVMTWRCVLSGVAVCDDMVLVLSGVAVCDDVVLCVVRCCSV